MKRTASVIAVLAALAATPALASDVYIKIDGIKGEAGNGIEVASWSFGVCNAGSCSASSTKRERGRESDASAGKGARSGVATGAGAAAGGAAIGDLDGDGVPDLAYAAQHDEIYGLALTLPDSAALRDVCKGKHIAKATLTRGSESFEITDAEIECGAPPAADAARGINRIDSTPARISTNFTVAKQTQTQSFGEKYQAGGGKAQGQMGQKQATITVVFVSGKSRYYTGHVSLLKM